METFEDACPYYMMFGMTYDQFWDGDVCAHKTYRAKYRLERETLRDDNNVFGWVNGLYIARAIASVFNGSKSAYPKEPMKLLETEADKTEEKQKAREDASTARAKTSMEIYMVNFNKRMNAKLDGKEGVDDASDSTGN